MSDETLEILQSYAKDPLLFRNYPLPDGPLMISDAPLRFIGTLDKDTLRIYPVDGLKPVRLYTITTGEGDIDIGYNAPRGLMYIPSSATPVEGQEFRSFFAWKRVYPQTGGYQFETIVPRRKKEKTNGGAPASGEDGPAPGDELEPFFVDLEIKPAGDHPELNELIKGSGALIWNGTGPPPKGILGLTVEMSDSLQYEIRFVQACVDYGRQHVETSGERLEELRDLASTGAGVAWDEMVRRLKRIGQIYFDLRRLRDLIAHLVFLDRIRKAGVAPGMWVLAEGREPKLSPETLELLEKLQVEGLDKLEQRLVIEGKKYSLVEFRDYLDKLIKMVRSRAPLLGRLEWDDLDPKLTDAQLEAKLRARLMFLAAEFLASNRKAQEMLGLSMRRVRQALGSNSPFPIPVVHIPKIWETVKQREKPEFDRDVLYWWAVEKMESNQKAMPFVMAAMELVIGFFCPPVGLLLGLATSFLDDEEATFKEALADADYDVDRTLASKAEAESARFWANVGFVLTIVGGVGDVLETARIFGKAAKESDEIAAFARALDEAVPESADGARLLDELGDASEAAADSKRLDDAFKSPISKESLGKTEKAAAEARADGVMGERAARLDPDADLDAAVRNVDDRLKKLAGDDFDDIKDSWLAYARNRRAAIAMEAADPQPLKFEHWVVKEVNRLKAARAPIPRAPRRQRSFLQYMIHFHGKGATSEAILELLADTAKARKRIREMLGWKSLDRLVEGWSDAERAFFRALREAGDALDDARLDRLLKEHILDPLSETASKVGGDRRLAVFVTNLPEGAALMEKADVTGALGRLLRHAEVDELRLDAILSKNLFRDYLDRLVHALDHARANSIEGVFTGLETASKRRRSTSLFDRLETGNRGYLFEMLVVGELAEHLPKGSKVIAGKHFDNVAWLRSLIGEHGGRFTKGGIINLVDADVLVELPNGKKILIDTKWTDVVDSPFKTKEEILEHMHWTAVWQIYKYERAVSEGIIDRAEFWLSHHLADQLMEVDVLRKLARSLSGENVRLISGVMEDPHFIRRFADQSMLGPAASWGPKIPPATRLGPGPSRAGPTPPPTRVVSETPLQVVKAVRPAEMPPAAGRLPLSDLDPSKAPTAASVLDSVRRINDRAVVGASGAIAARIARVTIRLPSVGKEEEPLTVRAHRVLEPGRGMVKELDVWRAAPDAKLGAWTASEIATSSTRPGEGLAILRALENGNVFQLAPVISAAPAAADVPRNGTRVISLRSPPPLYVVAWRAELPPLAGEASGRLHFYDGAGRLAYRHPSENTGEVARGWNFFPFAPVALIGNGPLRIVLNISEGLTGVAYELSVLVSR